MLTKEDLQRINELISREGVRDSSFPTTNLEEVEYIPVLSSGENRLISKDDLMGDSLNTKAISIDFINNLN